MNCQDEVARLKSRISQLERMLKAEREKNADYRKREKITKAQLKWNRRSMEDRNGE